MIQEFLRTITNWDGSCETDTLALGSDDSGNEWLFYPKEGSFYYFQLPDELEIVEEDEVANWRMTIINLIEKTETPDNGYFSYAIMVRDRGVYKVLRIFEDELYLDDVDIYGEVQSLDISYSELSPQSVEFKVYSV